MKLNWEVRTEIILEKTRLSQHRCWNRFRAVPPTYREPHDCQQLGCSLGILKHWQGRSSLHLTGSARHFRRLASKAHLPMVFLWIKNCDCSRCNLCFYKAASPQKALKYFASQRPHSDLSYIDINQKYPDGGSESSPLCKQHSWNSAFSWAEINQHACLALTLLS